MNVFANDNFDAHEMVVFSEDKETGLKAIIAVHDTTLGPSMGGCRMYPYATEADAIDDALRLSIGMSYKNALAGLPIGGGKAVIIGNHRTDASDEMWRAMGRFVNRLNGQYVTAEDSGTSVEAMRLIATQTDFVTGLADDQEHSGDPSPSTALGVFNAMKVAVAERFGQPNLSDLVVGVQGLGNVGRHLCQHLVDAGATVLGADPNEENAERGKAMGVRIVEADSLMKMDMDVFAPCAMGAILNPVTVPDIKAKLICGAANNQLLTPDVEAMLAQRGILYAPDFVINSGGIIDVFAQYSPSSNIDVAEKVNVIGETLKEVFELAKKTSTLPGMAAIEIAKKRIGRA